MPLTDEEKEGLSPEEIAAIEDPEGEGPKDQADLDADDQAAADKAAAEAEKEAADKAAAEKDEAEKTDSEKTAEAEAAAKAAKTAEDKAAADQVAADDIEAAKTEAGVRAPKAAMVPILPEVDPKDLESAKAKLDAAQKEFEDGKINFQEFDDVKSEYNRLKWKAEDAKEYNTHARNYQWKAAQDEFFRSHSIFKENKTLNVAYVAVVNEMLASDEGARLSDEELLEAARIRVEKDLQLPAGKKGGPTEAAALAAARKANADRKAIEDGDIAKLPSSEEETDPGEFDYLDRLTGAKYQEAVDRLTPAQLERYEALS